MPCSSRCAAPSSMPSWCARRRCIQDRPVSDAPLRIEIAYAEPQRAIATPRFLPPGSRVADALRLAALDPDFTGVDLANSALGIFGTLITPHDGVKGGAGIEMY